jgi:uroporphyrinogen decarboxylase
MIHAAGKYVFMHSDGEISEIIPDLVEIGVDALNCQLFCMDIEALAATHGGQLVFWGEIDRQRILPMGGVEDVRAAVRRVRAAFERGDGGVIAQLEWGKDVPRANVEAAFAAWLE